MARLTLLNVSMLLLLAAGRSSIAWPYPEGDSEHDSEVMEKNESTDDDLIQEQAVTEDEFNMQEQVPMKEFENVNAMADYHGGHSQTAEISQAGACGCDLKTYDQKYYQGRSLLIRQQNANFNNDYFNDRIESARVYGKCQWLLYQHSNFGGKYYILNPGYSYSKPSKWGGSGNRISSARALPPKGTKAIVLFQHNQYSGRMLVLYASNSNLPAIDFNDQLSSFIITGGRWALYEHTKYQGKSVVLGPGMYTSASTALGGAGGNDRISSIKVWKC